MKVTKDKIENCQAYLTIEIEPFEMEESLEKSYRRLVAKTAIPGFRKGKAPRDLLERYVGKEKLLEDTLEYLLPEAYEKALKEQSLIAIAQPKIEITQSKPIIFKAEVPLPPTVKLGDYLKIKAEPEKAEVTEDNVTEAIEQLRHRHATWEPIDHPVEFKDLVNIDVESTVEEKAFINQKGAQYQVLAELPLPIPGFADSLTGMKKDEEKEFKLKVPDDYPNKEVAGKEAAFKVKVTEIKQEKLHELNDELASHIDASFKDLATLREKVNEELKASAEENARLAFEDKVVEAAVDTTQLEYPPVMTEAEIDHMINQQMRRWQISGRGSFDEYLRVINRTEEQLREELKPMAEKRVARSITLGKISEEEKIKVSDDEINNEIDAAIQNSTEDKTKLLEFLNMPENRRSVEETLLGRKTVQRLVEIAKGN